MTAEHEVRLRVRVADPDGLHARPSAAIARAAESFTSRIVISYQGRDASARSVLELLSLGVLSSAEIELTVIGPDARECADAIAARLGSPSPDRPGR